MLHHLGGKLRADAGERPALLDRDQPVGLLHRVDDGLGVERAQAPQVDHLGVDALLGQLLGGVQRLADHDREGRDGDVLAGALDLGLADRQDEIGILRHVERLAVEDLVLEEDHRIGIADRGLEQALGVGGAPRRQHAQARQWAYQLA